MTTRWFGGATGLLGTARSPAGSRLLTTYPATWIVGDWPAGHVRVLRRPTGTLLVLGPCSATTWDLQRLPDDLPDRAAVAWSGAYTLVFTSVDGSVTVLTDPACARPVYLTRTVNNAVVWASSSRALAGLTHAAVDESWLAANLALPRATLPGRSAWAGVGLVPPGHRLRIRAGRAPTTEPAWHPPRTSRTRSAGRVRDVLADGVACRLSGPPAAPAEPAVAGELAALVELPPTDEPAPSATTWGRLAAELAALRAAGVGCHLSAAGADTLVGSPARFAQLVRTGRSPAAALTPEARERVAVLVRETPGRDRGGANRLLLDRVRRAARTARVEAQLADAFGIVLEHPYLDARLLDAMLAVPAHRRAVPDVVGPRGPAVASVADRHRDVHENLGHLLELADGELVRRRLVRPDWLRRQLTRAALGLDVSWSRLARVIATETWLRQVAQERPPAWVPAGLTS